MGLLAGGVCGARPPRVWKRKTRPPPGYSFLRKWTPLAGPSGDHVGALVLAWGGEVVRGGCFRAAERDPSKATVHWWTVPAEDAISGRPGSIRINAILANIGTIVLLDSEGNEIVP